MESPLRKLAYWLYVIFVGIPSGLIFVGLILLFIGGIALTIINECIPVWID